jgi:hypothetical protein
MIFAWPNERSTYHGTCVNRVKSHLKRICTDAGKERGFVPGRITDAYGYDKLTNTLYFCEIKVNPNDLLKAITQLHITSSNFKPKNPHTKIIPVIAIPKKLALEISKNKPLDWKSFKALCKTSHTAIWIIEQSSVRQLQGPKPNVPKTKVKKTTKVKVKNTLKSTKKPIKKRKTTTKSVKSRVSVPKSKSKIKPKTRRKTTTIKTRKITTKKPQTKRKPTKRK